MLFLFWNNVVNISITQSKHQISGLSQLRLIQAQGSGSLIRSRTLFYCWIWITFESYNIIFAWCCQKNKDLLKNYFFSIFCFATMIVSGFRPPRMIGSHSHCPLTIILCTRATNNLHGWLPLFGNIQPFRGFTKINIFSSKAQWFYLSLILTFLLFKPWPQYNESL